MDLMQFGFVEEALQAVSVNDIPADLMINTLTKLYNLLLLWFYFDIIKYVISVFNKVFNRLHKFEKG